MHGLEKSLSQYLIDRKGKFDHPLFIQAHWLEGLRLEFEALSCWMSSRFMELVAPLQTAITAHLPHVSQVHLFSPIL